MLCRSDIGFDVRGADFTEKSRDTSPNLLSSMKMPWTISTLEPENAAGLFSASKALMEALYPAESNHVVGLEAFTGDDALLIGAFVGEKPVGCVGWVLTSPQEAEVKRLFVDEHHRAVGIGRALMEALHDRARSAGITVLRLETGIHQAASLNLYTSLGYVEIEPFGDYVPDPLSVFFEKRWETEKG
jgi:putative acetyltransferase